MLDAFVRSLVADGRVELRAVAPPTDAEREATLVALARLFAARVLDVAGPAPAFAPDAALAATLFVRATCWALLHPGDAEAREAVVLDGMPRTPGEHLTADLLLAYLPSLHRRARALDAPLATRIEEVLLRFPLTGVLVELDAPPRAPLAFAHEGLDLLYAERFAERPRRAWLPPASGLRERVAFALEEVGRSLQDLASPLEESVT